MKKTFKSLLLVLALGTSFSIVGVSNMIRGGFKTPTVANAANVSIEDTSFASATDLLSKNLTFTYTKNVVDGVTTYSDFKNIEIQIKMTYDYSELALDDEDEVGILIIDDSQFEFDYTGHVYTDVYSWDDVLYFNQDATYHVYNNTERKNTYIAGVAIDELTHKSVNTTLYAGGFVNNYNLCVYYFTKDVEEFSLKSIVNDYLALDSLSDEQIAVLTGLKTYIDTL